MDNKILNRIKSYFSAPGLLFFIFAITLHMPLTVSLPGNLKVGELLMLVLVVPASNWIRASKGIERVQTYKVINWLAALLLWQLLADCIVGNRFSNLLAGSGTLGLCLIKVLMLSGMAIRFPAAVVPFLIGYATGHLAFRDPYSFGETLLQNEYWDLLVAPWAGSLLFAALFLFADFWLNWAMIGVICYAAAAAYYGARGHGLIALWSAVVPRTVDISKLFRLDIKRISLGRAILLCAVGSFIFGVIYVEASRAGLMTKKSEEQLDKVRNPYNPIELIRSGRPGVLLGLESAFERPIFGYGTMRYLSRAHDTSEALHSIVIESMIYSGLIVSVFWFFIASNIYKLYMPLLLKGPASSCHIAATMAMTSIAWTLLFSPFVSLRTDLPYCFAMIVHCSSVLRKDLRQY